jgi:hypothetical protein
MSIRIRTAFATAAVAGISFIAAPCAQASATSGSIQAASTQAISTQAALPGCVKTKTGIISYTKMVKVTNKCRYYVRAKVIIRAGRDSSCKSLAPGRSFTHRYGGYYQKTVSC